MLKLNSQVEITTAAGQAYSFNALHRCVISQDVETLTDTCTLELPRKIRWQGANSMPLRRGDRISIRLGYSLGSGKPAMPPIRFSGYIRSVSTSNPVILTCEDSMFILKTMPAPQNTYRKASLQKLVSDLLSGNSTSGNNVRNVHHIPFTLIDKSIALGPYRVIRPTVAAELAELQKNYGLRSYFRGEQLYIGLAYPIEGRITAHFAAGKNIIAEDLDYRHADDIRIRIKAVSIRPDNSRIIIETGDPDGELRTLNYFNLTEPELRTYATRDIARYKYTGLTGSITTFGEPAVNKADIADIKTNDGQHARHLISKLEISFGIEGYRQTVTLGPPLS